MTLTYTDHNATSAAASLSLSQLEMMRAFFSCEFEVVRLDRESIPAATPEVVAEWIEALKMSGLFARSELDAMTAAWLDEPDALLSLLAGDVDEVAARRDIVEGVDVAETELPRAS